MKGLTERWRKHVVVFTCKRGPGHKRRWRRERRGGHEGLADIVAIMAGFPPVKLLVLDVVHHLVIIFINPSLGTRPVGELHWRKKAHRRRLGLFIVTIVFTIIIVIILSFQRNRSISWDIVSCLQINIILVLVKVILLYRPLVYYPCRL